MNELSINKNVKSDEIISSERNLNDQNNLNDTNDSYEDSTCYFMDYEEDSYESQEKVTSTNTALNNVNEKILVKKFI